MLAKVDAFDFAGCSDHFAKWVNCHAVAQFLAGMKGVE
jgi:hypothetical protein